MAFLDEGENDPNGKKSSDPGAKLDEGKLRAGLVLKSFSFGLEAVVRIGTFGANKYSDNGWLDVPDAEKRYHDAFHRHILKMDQGEVNDPDSKMPHMWHMAWNALALIELQARKKGSL